MSEMQTNKIEAAQRVIDAAIRMLFSGEDPLAIHLLAMSAFRVLRDLSEKCGDVEAHRMFTSFIRPGKEKKFWRKFNEKLNFLKHADKDPHTIIGGFNERINDLILFVASTYYQNLENTLTPEMSALVCWYLALNPDFLPDEIIQSKLLPLRSRLIRKSRRDQLKLGKELLELSNSVFPSKSM